MVLHQVSLRAGTVNFELVKLFLEEACCFSCRFVAVFMQRHLTAKELGRCAH